MSETMPEKSKNGVTIKVATRDKTGYDRLRKGGNVRRNVYSFTPFLFYKIKMSRFFTARYL